ncbi:hypothetical protein HBI45_234460 [Parastagonospora nodorum]|nr:hypothetical protein HBI45_234460 [Parastagonospora nodorum]KAH6519845.1 hypothetical protein HBI07_233140 [Parastagonospora nodorum]
MYVFANLVLYVLRKCYMACRHLYAAGALVWVQSWYREIHNVGYQPTSVK